MPWFLVQAVRGGIDVAGRALRPSLPLEPDFLSYAVRLPEGSARVFFLNCISLLPGTFSAEFDGERIRVHLLAEPEKGPERLDALEARVARLFGAELGEVPGEAPR